ncbi:MAG: ribonuclease HII [Rothia sp. (in: high G+C Gram-positive bacteria)]|nr:ribonuclease HII [Rothia sp. (in: high G+C Gram-positive bacteria)]
MTVRSAADLSYEEQFWEQGLGYVAGMDEVGRGALAGPVTVGLTALKAGTSLQLEGLTDSKALTEKKRLALAPLIRQWAAGAVGHASPAEIDALGMTLALRLAGQRALARLAAEGIYPDALLLDGKHNWLQAQADLFADLDPAQQLYRSLCAQAWEGLVGGPEGWIGPVRMLIGGDYLAASISAASVLAKVERDQIMQTLASSYPAYDWQKNKGYGSAQHRQQIQALGPSPLHRLSWSLPVTAQQLKAAYQEREKKSV